MTLINAIDSRSYKIYGIDNATTKNYKGKLDGFILFMMKPAKADDKNERIIIPPHMYLKDITKHFICQIHQ